MRVLVTHHSPQSIASVRASQPALMSLGVTFVDVPIGLWGRRLWRYWRVPLWDLRLLGLILFGGFDFVLLNPGTAWTRRPTLLSLAVRAAHWRGLLAVMFWHSDKWLIEANVRVEGRRKDSLISALQRPELHHVAVSERSAEEIRDAFDVSDVRIVGNAVSIEASTDDLAPAEPPLIVNVASASSRKGADLFVDIAERVCAKHSDVRFKWIGKSIEPNLIGPLERQLREGPYSNRIEFAGPIYPATHEMSKASALLFTSRSDAFGLAAAEAMALSRTVVCFEGTGTVEVIGSTGVVVPRFDTGAAAESLLELIARPPQERINEPARQRYAALYTPQQFASRLVDALRSIESL